MLSTLAVLFADAIAVTVALNFTFTTTEVVFKDRHFQQTSAAVSKIDDMVRQNNNS